MRSRLRTCVDRRSNAPRTFYHPDRFAAQLMWFESGEVEYRFSLGEIDPKQVEWLEISMEISSNAPMYREDFKSDIYVGLGARELGVWTSPGDYGGGAAASTRRGGATPPPNTACSKRGASTAWLHARRRAAFKRHRRGFAARRTGVHPPAHRYSRGRGARRRHQPVRRKNSAISRRASSCGWATPRRTDFAAKCPQSEKFSKSSKYEISSRFVSSYQKTETNRRL